MRTHTQRHHEEMVSVTQSLESLQQVIANQRSVIEELRHAGRPSGEPLEEIHREMDAMARMHEARMRQEQERASRLQQQLAEAQGDLSFLKTQQGVDTRIVEMEKELDELRAVAKEAAAKLPEEMAKVYMYVCMYVCMCFLRF